MSPVFSMTGFSTSQGETALGHITVELRSVNSRFLDLLLKLPDELRLAEPAVRELISKRVGRGKLECRISLKKSLTANIVDLNQDALRTLKTFEEGIRRVIPGVGALRTIDILSYPGILQDQTIDEKSLVDSVVQTLDKALELFNASREREGSALSKVLLNYCDQIDSTVASVRRRIPDIVKAMSTKLQERLESALTQALTEKSLLSKAEVNERIRQEVTVYALRVDVDEEMNRLNTHVNEVRRNLAQGGSVGRRLDFLMQEMNREANTLGSKADAIEMTNASLDLKLFIEQMREQIQNLQ